MVVKEHTRNASLMNGRSMPTEENLAPWLAEARETAEMEAQSRRA